MKIRTDIAYNSPFQNYPDKQEIITQIIIRNERSTMFMVYRMPVKRYCKLLRIRTILQRIFQRSDKVVIFEIGNTN